MSISYSKIKQIAYFCLLLPSMVFVLGFIRWYIALPVAVLLAAAYFCVLRDSKKEAVEYEDKTLNITAKQMFAIIGIVLVIAAVILIGIIEDKAGDK